MSERSFQHCLLRSSDVDMLLALANSKRAFCVNLFVEDNSDKLKLKPLYDYLDNMNVTYCLAGFSFIIVQRHLVTF